MTFHSVYRSMATMPAALLTSLSLRHAQLLSRRVAAISMMALRRASPQSLAVATCRPHPLALHHSHVHPRRHWSSSRRVRLRVVELEDTLPFHV